MMLRKERLFTPGPTALHPEVIRALAKPIIHHRTDEFRALFKSCSTGLKEFFRTSDEVFILASSGTGAMEAAIVNLLSPADKMIACVAGNFGERWAQLGKAHGMNVTVLEAGWGEAVTPEAIKAALDKDPEIKAVFVQLSESSTGACHDVEAIAKVTRASQNTLLVVDAISGAGAMKLETEAWGIDVVVVGSQKALALPPGLAFISANARAWERIEAGKSPRFYFDLRKEKKSQGNGETAFTPAISLIVALKAALDFIGSLGGVTALVENAGTLAGMTRAAGTALGLPFVSPKAYGDALTAFYPPPGVDSGAIVKGLKSEFLSTVAGGQGALKGKIFRVAHLGYYDTTDILGLLGTLEIVLQKLGHKFEAGKGTAAATQEYLRRTAGK